MAWRGKQNTFMYARARERQRETTHILFEHPTTFSPAATTRRRCCLVVVSASYKLHQHTNTNTPTYLHTSTPSHTLSTPSHTPSSYIPLPPCSSRHGCLKNCRAANPSLQLHARMSRPSLIECEMLTLL